MFVWIAGWPHNGSTLCRQILKDSFEIPTYSRYPEEALKELFPGSVEFSKQLNTDFFTRHQYYLEHNTLVFAKTHQLPTDNEKAIFVYRDGRDAVCSLSNFWSIPIKDAICGMGCGFGTWSSYYYGWNPKNRPNTLMLKFEDMVHNPNEEASRISDFLNRPQLHPYVDDFEEKKKLYPYLFNDRTGVWHSRMTQDNIDLFWQCHGDVMRELGYER